MSDNDTVDRACLVTGAGKRIGRAIARDLARRGWAVGVHYSHSGDGARELVDEIEAAGGRAVALEADFEDPDAVDSLVPDAVAALGPITLLVNNAAIFDRDEPGSLSRDSWRRNIDINLRAPVFLTEAFVHQMPAGVQGNIVNILDQRVWSPTPFFMSYTVSKAGLWMLTRTWALALAPRVRVNAVGPGFALPSPNQTEAQFAESKAIQPLKRGTTAEEICDAVAFILDAPAMTGQMIALDGGQHLGWAQAKDGGWPLEG